MYVQAWHQCRRQHQIKRFRRSGKPCQYSVRRTAKLCGRKIEALFDTRLLPAFEMGIKHSQGARQTHHIKQRAHCQTHDGMGLQGALDCPRRESKLHLCALNISKMPLTAIKPAIDRMGRQGREDDSIQNVSNIQLTMNRKTAATSRFAGTPGIPAAHTIQGNKPANPARGPARTARPITRPS